MMQLLSFISEFFSKKKSSFKCYADKYDQNT